MQQLIDQLIIKQGLSTTQASDILSTIKEFIEDNFPSFGNSLDTVFTKNGLTGPGNYFEIRAEADSINPLNTV